jgi:L-alanine-DL-glutamate epimerase-like enolase superfamily enzyme
LTPASANCWPTDPEIDGGEIELLDSPGLGRELDESLVEEYAICV